MEESDAAVVSQCLAGRKDAYATIVERHQNVVFAVCLRSTRDREEAADLTQEVFVQAYRKLATFNPAYPFRVWLMAICANMAKNRLRGRERRRKAHESYAAMAALSEGPRADRQAALAEALEMLPEKLRTPLLMKHVAGLSYEETADALGIGVSAAKMRVKRGRDRLLSILGLDAENDRDKRTG
jgi:RNA polymerase sigma-70 factor (ECF subfamily)